MVILRRGLSPALLGGLTLALLLAGWTVLPTTRAFLRERCFDLILPLLPAPPPNGAPGVVIADIDRAAIARFGPWPWPRERLAALTRAIATAHPAAIAIDILFAGADRFSSDGDAALAHALEAAPAALGFVLESASSGQQLAMTPILARSPVELPGIWRAAGVIGPSPPLSEAAQGFGALVSAADDDGEIRRMPLLVLAGDAVRPSLAVEAVRLAEGAGALLITPEGRLRIGDHDVPLGQDAMLRLNGRSSARWLPAASILDASADPAAMAGRIVVIGGSAPELGGLRVTPASSVTPSVSLQAAAIATILRGAIDFRPAWAVRAEVAGAVALGLLGVSLAVRLRPAIAAALAALTCIGWSAACVGATAGFTWLIDPAGPPLIALGTFASTMLARFARDEWRARVLRLSFEQHLAPDVVRRIAADPGSIRLRGELREITALFTDIEDFTSMTERAEPGDLVALLDAYFEATTRVITDHGGMIDKIVGDAIHAIFNAPFSLPDHPRCAVNSALALLQVSETMRLSALGQRLGLGRTRIGIETGTAIVGDVGGNRKLDYTAHGNAMNAAARLEAANKEFGSSICIGQGTADRLDPATLRPIGKLIPRGQSHEVTVYTPAVLPTPPP